VVLNKEADRTISHSPHPYIQFYQTVLD